MVVCFVCLFVCFVCLFVAILCPILGYLKKIEALVELRKMLLRKKYSVYGLGIAKPLKYLIIFCRFTGFTKRQLI